MRSTLLLLLLVAVPALPAANSDARPVPANVGPERFLANAAFERPAIASHTTGLLVAWNAPDANGQNHLGVQRLTVAGVPVGVKTAVGVNANPQRDPVLRSDGTNALVAWNEVTTAGASLRAAIVDGTTGVPSAPFTIAPTLAVQYFGAQHLLQVAPPVVAWTGSVYRVFWLDGAAPGGAVAMGATVTAQGVVAAKFPLGAIPRIDDATDGARTTLVGWQSVAGRLMLFTVTVDESGHAGAPVTVVAELETGLAYLWPAIARSSAATLASWVDQRAGGADTIEATRVDAAGAPLDTVAVGTGTRGFVLEPPTAGKSDSNLVLLADGAGFALVWQRSGNGTFSGIWSLRLDANGRPLAPRDPIALRSPLGFDDPELPAAARLADGTLAVAYVRDATRAPLYVRLVAPTAHAKRRAVRP